MECLGLGLPCNGQGQHECHDVVAGKAPGTQSVSEYAGRCPVQFVKAVVYGFVSVAWHHIEKRKAELARWCKTSGTTRAGWGIDMD